MLSPGFRCPAISVIHLGHADTSRDRSLRAMVAFKKEGLDRAAGTLEFEYARSWIGICVWLHKDADALYRGPVDDPEDESDMPLFLAQLAIENDFLFKDVIDAQRNDGFCQQVMKS